MRFLRIEYESEYRRDESGRRAISSRAARKSSKWMMSSIGSVVSLSSSVA